MGIVPISTILTMCSAISIATCFTFFPGNEFGFLQDAFEEFVVEDWKGLSLERSCFGVHPNSARAEGGRDVNYRLRLARSLANGSDAGQLTGEVVEKTLRNEASEVREFYSTLSGPAHVWIEATGSMQWFVSLMEELGIECLVGHPAKIRAAEPRKQKHDRRVVDLWFAQG